MSKLGANTWFCSCFKYTNKIVTKTKPNSDNNRNTKHKLGELTTELKRSEGLNYSTITLPPPGKKGKVGEM